MPSLKTTQTSFARAVYDNRDDDLLGQIKSSDITNEERLKIYKDNVSFTLYDTLKSRYPAICKLVDEKFFRYAVQEYIKDNRPKTGNLDDYGENFYEFLADFPPTKNFVYLPDVAKLEWLLHLAYFAADSEPIDKDALAKVPPEQLENIKFSLHPSSYLISSEYPIDKLIEIAEDTNININERGADILVVRPEYRIETILLVAGEYEFLSAIKNGATLYSAYEKAAEKNENFDVGLAIAKFVGNGVFVGFGF